MMAFSSALKSFPKMFNQHVFLMPKIIQKNQTSFRNWKSAIGDLRATLGKRHILTVAGPQSKMFSIDAHLQTLGKQVMCNKLSGRVITRGLSNHGGGRSDVQTAPRPSNDRAGETKALRSGKDYNRANRLMNVLLHANWSQHAAESPSRAYRLVVTKSRVPAAYADHADRTVVVSVGMVRELNDDELTVAMGHLLALVRVHEVTEKVPPAGPASLNALDNLSITTHALTHLSCALPGLSAYVVCQVVLFVDAVAALSYAGWRVMETAWAKARVPVAKWRDACAADREGLRMAVRAGVSATAGRAMLRKFDWIDREYHGRWLWLPSATRLASWYRAWKMRRSVASLAE